MAAISRRPISTPPLDRAAMIPSLVPFGDQPTLEMGDGTEHVAELARGGVRFTALRLCQRPTVHAFACRLDDRPIPGPLPASTPTRRALPHALYFPRPERPSRRGRSALVGDATGIVGKWHRSDGCPNQTPLELGFDEFFGFLDSEHSYFGEQPGDPGNPIYRGRVRAPEAQYLTRAFAREAVGFIQRHADEPFFL